jgi:RNA ligase
MGTRISDLFDVAELETLINDGYVRRQVHPSAPLSILNYTEKAQYERVWTDVTRRCRFGHGRVGNGGGGDECAAC